MKLVEEIIAALPEDWRAPRGVPSTGKLSRKQVNHLVRLLAARVVAGVEAGERVLVPGLGVFRPVAQRARTVSVHGKAHDIPPMRVIKFRASRKVRQLSGGAP